MSAPAVRKIASFKDAAELREYAVSLGLALEIDDEIVRGDASPIARPVEVLGRRVGNSACVHPMEGWDSSPEGGLSDTMLRRWRRFGESGCKLIWGCEAMAVREDGRSNARQLVIAERTKADLGRLLGELKRAHREAWGDDSDLVVGFQLTHSGRYSKPEDKPAPLVAYRHPLLDGRSGVTSGAQIVTDDDIERLIDLYVSASCIASDLGVDFVDVKHCHGYLLHELLGARTRPGAFGGPFENRTRFLRRVVEGIRAERPALGIGVRVSAADMVPYKPDDSRGRVGAPVDYSTALPYDYGFGVDREDPERFDLTETFQLFELFAELGIELVNVTVGSPYYNPHIQRPAMFPPSDGYLPPEDPLVGVERQMRVVRELKTRSPALKLVGSGYSYLQEYLPHVAQAELRAGRVDFVGIGRAVLSYPRMLLDAVTKGELDRRMICRTFSDCTTAPRAGLRSGCYPLDHYYKELADAATLKAAKSAGKGQA